MAANGIAEMVNVDELLKNESFRDWVLKPASASDAYWPDFMARYPDQQPVIDQARSILLALDHDVRENHPTPEQYTRIYANIQDRMHTAPVRTLAIGRRWLIAATVVLCLGVALYRLFSGKSPVSPHYSALVDRVEVALLENVNDTPKPLKVVLPDKSIVWLQPESRISYAKNFTSGAKREVYLSGNAFFDITKHPDQPFFVYADELITKVLGTSFWVKTNPANDRVVVEVKTGKVSVFARSDSRAGQMQANRELEGVVLTPNQQLTFSNLDVRMKKSLVANPEPVINQEFAFRDERVATVFSSLEQAYGIDIIYDEDLLANCLLTATLTDEPLYEKLKLICKGIEGHYEIVDAQIVVTAKGCQE